MFRRIAAGLLIAFDVVWTIGFPKNASLAPGFVGSVAISIGLFGSAILVLLSNRIGRGRTTLSILLLLSILMNAYQLAQERALQEIVMNHVARHR